MKDPYSRKRVYRTRRVRSRKNFIDRLAASVYLVVSTTCKTIYQEIKGTSSHDSVTSKPSSHDEHDHKEEPTPKHSTPTHLDIREQQTQHETQEEEYEVVSPHLEVVARPRSRAHHLDLSQGVSPKQTKPKSTPVSYSLNLNNEEEVETELDVPVQEVVDETKKSITDTTTRLTESLSYSSRKAMVLLAKQGVSSWQYIGKTKSYVHKHYPFLFTKRTFFAQDQAEIQDPVSQPKPSIFDEADRVAAEKKAPSRLEQQTKNIFKIVVGGLTLLAVQLYSWLKQKAVWMSNTIVSLFHDDEPQLSDRINQDQHTHTSPQNQSTMANLKRVIKKRIPKNPKKMFSTKGRKGIWLWLHRLFLAGLIAGFVGMGIFFIWVASLEIPDSNIDERIVAQSTKIYDATGEVLLYDVYKDERRTVVPLDAISDDMKKAILATEDDEFYEHGGYDVSAIIRSVCYETASRLGLGTLGGTCPRGGGSTITQQVIKNTLLNNDRRIERKIKEVVLARKLEGQKNKDEILEIYLNEIAFGGPVYGVEQAALSIFGKSAIDLSIRESTYIAALPKAPSTYRNDKAKWKGRADYILNRMLELGYINDNQYKVAFDEEVEFVEIVDAGIKAPHFVFYVQEQLEEQLSSREDDLTLGGYNVRTTLNWELQQGLEEVVDKHVERLESYNASNMAIVAIENSTGKIVGMVGSKDFFAEDIDGKFNVANAPRQPGSTFKPFVYAKAFTLGYTPDTILWDTKTEFNQNCYPDGSPRFGGVKCYNPSNFDKRERGPVSIRSALAMSLNIPAVKALYLTGVSSAMQFSKDMGITTLNRAPSFYGLNLVLGGGEVKLVDMVGAYSVFANDGIRHRLAVWEDVTDPDGLVLEEYEDKKEQVIPANAARMVSSVLSDNNAKIPMFGAGSPLYYYNTPVAVKTGTTNNFKDVWTVGYTPEITIGVWAGNNDNTPIASRPSSTVVGPIWRDAMDVALEYYTPTRFKAYTVPNAESLKPILRGEYQGGSIIYIDPETGETVENPTEEELAAGLYLPQGSAEYHSILHYVSRSQNAQTSSGGTDGLYENFEYGVQQYVEADPEKFPQTTIGSSTIEDLLSQIEDQQGNTNTDNGDGPVDIVILSPSSGELVNGDKRYTIEIDITGNSREVETVYYYLNNTYLGAGTYRTTSMRVTPNKTRGVQKENLVKVILETKDGRRVQQTASLILE